MIIRTTTPRRHRLAILATVFALHILLLAIFLRQHSTPPSKTPPAAIGLIAIAAQLPAPSQAAPISLRTKLTLARKPPTKESMAPTTQGDGVNGATIACATLDAITNNLIADPLVLDVIHRAPPETRSIADAIVMWNAGWLASAQGVDTPLGPVRALVEQTLAASDARCLDEPVMGPRLVPIPNGDRTMYLVFGSGTWTWRDLVAAPPSGIADPTIPAAG